MVEVHTLDAWLSPGAPHDSLWAVLLMMGGFAAPSFLFMAGMSQSLADAALARKGRSAPERRRRALGRALWVLGVAYAFRLAEYVLGGAWRVPGGWQDILRVDILNVIALSLTASALFTVGVPARLQPWLAAAAAAAVAFLTPVVAGWQHPPSRILDYLYAVWPRANFAIFPWAGFLFAGSALGRLAGGTEEAGSARRRAQAKPEHPKEEAGSARRRVQAKPEHPKDRPFAFLGLGAALFAWGQLADRMPPVYALQDFWRTSPAWFFMRLGGVVALAGALQLLPSGADRVLSWLRTVGRHSLLGYIASVELTYGTISSIFHKALSMESTVASIVAMIFLTWVLSLAADRWDTWRSGRAAAGASTSPAP